MKLIEDNPDKKAIYLAPSLGILLQLKTPNGQTIKMTYQTLARLDDEEIKNLGIDLIILDEFHHIGVAYDQRGGVVVWVETDFLSFEQTFVDKQRDFVIYIVHQRE